jgi:hypothetical protein
MIIKGRLQPEAANRFRETVLGRKASNLGRNRRLAGLQVDVLDNGSGFLGE